MTVQSGDIVWQLGRGVRTMANRLRVILGDNYEDDKRALRGFLTSYFGGDNGDCTTGSNSIKPLGGGSGGWKRLKVRWALPGSGKSGGLRLAITVHCESKRVVLVGAWSRKDDPSAEEFQAAFDSEGY